MTVVLPMLSSIGRQNNKLKHKTKPDNQDKIRQVRLHPTKKFCTAKEM